MARSESPVRRARVSGAAVKGIPTREEALRWIADLAFNLDTVKVELTESAEVAVQARHKAKVKEQRAFMLAQGPIDHRKATAFLEAEKELLEADLAEMRMQMLREEMRKIYTQMDAARSINTAQTQQWRHEAVGQDT